MQTVSTNFKNAAVAATITPAWSVKINLTDNQSLAGNYTIVANTSGETACPPSAGANGLSVLGGKWAFADAFAEGSGGRFLADGTFYPCDVGYEVGWQGTTIADASGNIAGGESFILKYTSPTPVQIIELWADQTLGIPVNFVIDYDPTGTAGYTTIATVTGNAATYYKYTMGSVTNMKLLRITVTKINYGSQPVRFIEFQGSYQVDVSSAVKQFNILQERFPDNASIQLGTSSAGTLTLEQDNTTNLWFPHGNSTYSQFLRANRRIYVQAGFVVSGGATELVPLGTFYSMQWNASANSPVASVIAQDRMKKLRDVKYRKCPLMVNKTVTQCIFQALQDAGFSASDSVLAQSTLVIPYAWASPDQSFFDYITQLATVAGGVVYFDENDVLHFQDATYLSQNSRTSVMTFTDANAVIATDDEWIDGNVKNRVVVNINALKLASSAVIWNLQETLTIPGNSTYNYTVKFSSGVTNVQTPVITAQTGSCTISGMTAYAQTAVITISNPSAAAATITGMTITAQALTSDGASTAISETSQVTAGSDQPRELPLNNSFIQTSAVGNPLAANLLSVYSNPPSKIHVETLGMPHLELGDRVTVNSASTGITGDFWVMRHQFKLDGFRSTLDLYSVTDALPDRSSLWPQDATVVSGNAIATDFTYDNPYNDMAGQVATYHAGDSFTYGFVLSGGTYYLEMLGSTGSDRGIVDFYLDNTYIGSLDWYSTSVAVGQIKTLSISCLYDGYHVLKCVVSSKNSGSSNYHIAFNKIAIVPRALTDTLAVIPTSNVTTNTYPTRATLWAIDGTTVAGVAPVLDTSNAIQQAQWWRSVMSTTAAGANGDSVSWSVLLDVGVYTATVIGRQNNFYGIVDWYLDGVLIVSGQDWYASPGGSNKTATFNITIASAGYHAIKYIVNGKNASSTGYTVEFTKTIIKRTND